MRSVVCSLKHDLFNKIIKTKRGTHTRTFTHESTSVKHSHQKEMGRQTMNLHRVVDSHRTKKHHTHCPHLRSSKGENDTKYLSPKKKAETTNGLRTKKIFEERRVSHCHRKCKQRKVKNVVILSRWILLLTSPPFLAVKPWAG